jgi:hypothetical protein
MKRNIFNKMLRSFILNTSQDFILILITLMRMQLSSLQLLQKGVNKAKNQKCSSKLLMQYNFTQFIMDFRLIHFEFKNILALPSFINFSYMIITHKFFLLQSNKYHDITSIRGRYSIIKTTRHCTVE